MTLTGEIILAVLAILYVSLFAMYLWAQWYWSRQVQKLLDKLMSRNYAEYVQVQQPQATVPRGNISFRPEDHLEDLSVLNGLEVR